MEGSDYARISHLLPPVPVFSLRLSSRVPSLSVSLSFSAKTVIFAWNKQTLRTLPEESLAALPSFAFHTCTLLFRRRLENQRFTSVPGAPSRPFSRMHSRGFCLRIPPLPPPAPLLFVPETFSSAPTRECSLRESFGCSTRAAYRHNAPD